MPVAGRMGPPCLPKEHKELIIMGNCVRENPLRTRADVERAAVQLIEPLIPLLSEGRARLHLGDTGAVYPPEILPA